MPEPRFDPLGRRTILLAPERAARGAPAVPPAVPDPAPCDFCGGREDRTPPETYREPNAAQWRVRAFPNLFPAAAFHEVVVHSPDHLAAFEGLDPTHRLDVMRAWSARLAAAGARCGIAAFNRGREAGASRSHEHAQVIGLGLVPPTLGREREAFSDDPCVLCGIDEPLAEHGGVRIVVHPVPLVAHELLIVPACFPRFEDADDAMLEDLGAAIADALGRVGRAFGDGLATNLVLHTAPGGVERFHWHLHLYPRTAVWGALELGAELPIVAADPSATAELL